KVPNMHVTIGKPFQYHIAAPEDTYVAVVSGLPAGLVFHPLSSEIIGTPAESPEGDYRVGITTYNRHGQVGNGSFVMTLTHKDHGNPSVIQEILRRPERGVELIKELIQKLLGTNQQK
ncbi:MAG: Ig domain-containing protein, partial [Corynebacterium sp.]|nr:Ig domain-containing protein [Corynebacterium sp.]